MSKDHLTLTFKRLSIELTENADVEKLLQELNTLLNKYGLVSYSFKIES